MSALHKSVMTARLPPRPSKATGMSKDSSGMAKKRNYAPTAWNRYFHESQDVETPSGTFRAYFSSPPDEPDRPRLVVLHGGGYSGLSWSLFTAEITRMIQCQVIAIDFRGHGDTKTDDDGDMSADTLTNDIVQVLEKLFVDSKPPLVLIGHSMGGAIAVRVANSDMSLSIIGLAVIDVVEGTAMESLSSMQSFLRGRPAHFKSIEHAIEWCVRSGQTRSTESAKVSMPGQIVNAESGKLASSELDNYQSFDDDDGSGAGPPAKRLAGVVISDSIAEDPQEGEDVDLESNMIVPPLPAIPKADTNKYLWRIDLSKTERFWSGWFQGLSQAFLGCAAPKMLLLANISGLDKDLTVGQMQGKFQMQVLTRCGHAVHEDNPEEVAQVIASFMIRHKFTEPASPEMTHLGLMPGC